MYVFDTDMLSLLMKDRLPEGVFERMRAAAERAQTTAITLGELYYGALRSAATQRWLTAISGVVERLPCLHFDAESALRYAEIRSYLERQGRRLDDPDLRIAAICLANDYILVSGNARHFERIPGLRYENWLATCETD